MMLIRQILVLILNMINPDNGMTVQPELRKILRLRPVCRRGPECLRTGHHIEATLRVSVCVCAIQNVLKESMIAQE